MSHLRAMGRHLPFVISGPDHLICGTDLITCGPCDNFCYLGHTKKIPMMMMMIVG